MKKRYFRKKKARPELSPQQAEQMAVASNNLARVLIKKRRIPSARYHASVADYIFKNHREPDGKTKRRLYLDAIDHVKKPFKAGKGKGYDVYPPAKGIKALEGIAIVEGPDKYPMKFSSMQEAIGYVRAHNLGDLPVRVHKGGSK